MRLSKYEIRVLEKMILGLSNHEIASELYLSYHTVKSHVQRSLARNQAGNRIGLAVKYILFKQTFVPVEETDLELIWNAYLLHKEKNDA